MRNRFQFSRANRFCVSKILTHGTSRSRRLYGKVRILMKALPSHSKWLALGLGIWAVLACSAEASEPPAPKSTGQNTGGTPGAGGSPTTTGGSPAIPQAGSTTTPGTGGTPTTTTGGTPGTGTAGTPGTGMAGTPATGTGGGGALTVCPSPPAAGTVAEASIDDLEDKDNALLKVGGRTGFWYTYLDTLGSTIIPAPDKTKTMPIKATGTDCHGGMGCMLVTGMTGMQDDEAGKYPYAGIGFDFSNAMKPCPYNASAYTGIKFWAKGDAQIRLKINVASTTSADGGGTCTPMAGPPKVDCNDGHGVDLILTPTWTEQKVAFADLLQAGWGVVGSFDKTALLSLQIQFPPGQPSFTANFDDLAFY